MGFPSPPPTYLQHLGKPLEERHLRHLFFISASEKIFVVWLLLRHPLLPGKMLSSTAMSKQSDGVLRELVSTREASMGVRKLCVRGGLSYISMGGQYQDYTDTCP